MTCRDLFNALAAAGVSLRLDEGHLRAYPGSRLTDELRAALREHRERLLAARCIECGKPTAGYDTCPEHDPFEEPTP